MNRESRPGAELNGAIRHRRIPSNACSPWGGGPSTGQLGAFTAPPAPDASWQGSEGPSATLSPGNVEDLYEMLEPLGSGRFGWGGWGAPWGFFC